MQHVIEFYPPVLNLDGKHKKLNTFRLGAKYHKILTPGEEVLLIDRREHRVIGRALIKKVELGPLAEMCSRHGRYNHNHLSSVEPHATLLASLKRRYGPNAAQDDKATTVIWFQVVT